MTLADSSGSITITIPQIHWAGTSATIITCVLIIVVMWRWGKTWDHRVHILLALLIGIALTLTNAGAWALAHIHNWTNGLFG